jgi:hypothetical protein
MLLKKESPAKSLRMQHIAEEMATISGELRLQKSLPRVPGGRRVAQKTKDPLRGPPGSLGRVELGGTDAKALPLSPFTES